MQTAWDHVRLAAERTPGHLAIVDDQNDRSYTFQQLVEEVEAVAAGFMEGGIGPGQRTATVLPNVIEHAVAILAFHRLRTEVCLVNPRLKPEEIGALLREAGVSTVVCTSDAALIDAARRALPRGAPLYTCGGALEDSINFASCHGNTLHFPDWVSPEPEENAFILYTSGTTGLPKGVMIPHRATDARVLYAVVQCGLRHGTHNRALGLMPLFHAVGFYSSFLTTLSLNGTYYVHSHFNPVQAIEIIKTQKITFLYGAPAHFHALLTAPNFDPNSVNTVNTLVYAGAVMPGALLDRVSRAFPGALMTNIYGTTEVMNSLYMSEPVGRPFTLRPGFYSNVRVARVGGPIDEVCPDGEEGELLVDATSDACFRGYLNRPDVTAERLVDGWYRTGDIVLRQEGGDFELRGRVDDMIISGGENIHPEEIELVLMNHAAVQDVAVVGLPDDQWSERVAAFVVLNKKDVTSTALDQWCKNSTLANYKRPRDYIFVDVLPRNAANKILRGELKKLSPDANTE